MAAGRRALPIYHPPPPPATSSPSTEHLWVGRGLQKPCPARLLHHRNTQSPGGTRALARGTACRAGEGGRPYTPPSTPHKCADVGGAGRPTPSTHRREGWAWCGGDKGVGVAGIGGGCRPSPPTSSSSFFPHHRRGRPVRRVRAPLPLPLCSPPPRALRARCTCRRLAPRTASPLRGRPDARRLPLPLLAVCSLSSTADNVAPSSLPSPSLLRPPTTHPPTPHPTPPTATCHPALSLVPGQASCSHTGVPLRLQVCLAPPHPLLSWFCSVVSSSFFPLGGGGPHASQPAPDTPPLSSRCLPRHWASRGSRSGTLSPHPPSSHPVCPPRLLDPTPFLVCSAGCIVSSSWRWWRYPTRPATPPPPVLAPRLPGTYLAASRDSRPDSRSARPAALPVHLALVDLRW